MDAEQDQRAEREEVLIISSIHHNEGCEKSQHATHKSSRLQFARSHVEYGALVR